MTDIKNEIKNYVTGKRYDHTLSVADECLRLGKMFGLDASENKRLYHAALLHDITKGEPPERQLELCRQFLRRQ